MRNTLIDNNLNVSENGNLSKFPKLFRFYLIISDLIFFNDKKVVQK